MSASALIAMLITWSIVGFFTVRFFVRILKNPHLKTDAEDEAKADPGETKHR
jgi:hypothetical protein